MEKIKKYGKHVCWILMLSAGIYLLWSVYRFHILPMKYKLPVTVIVVAIFTFLIYAINERENKLLNGFGCVVSLLLCVCMIFLSISVVNKAHETVEAVSNGNIKTTEISVLVKKTASLRILKTCIENVSVF